MRLLVLGGTGALGAALVDEARVWGSAVTVVNRGETGPREPDGVDVVRADRSDHATIRALADRHRWDAVIDASGILPDDVAAAVEALAPRTGRYLFVSSVAALRWPEYDASQAGLRPPDPEVDLASPECVDYPQAKAAGERLVASRLGASALVVRPAMMSGPHDTRGPVSWWLHKVARGGDVLAPGDPARPFQLADVRDVAHRMMELLERGATGAWNVAGAVAGHSFGDLVEACVAVTASDARPVWVPDPVLQEHHVRPWAHLPLWHPVTTPGAEHLWSVPTTFGDGEAVTRRHLADTLAGLWATRTVDPVAEWATTTLPDEIERSLLATARAEAVQ